MRHVTIQNCLSLTPSKKYSIPPPPLLCISDIKTTLKEGGGNMGNRPKKERETADHPWGLQ